MQNRFRPDLNVKFEAPCSGLMASVALCFLKESQASGKTGIDRLNSTQQIQNSSGSFPSFAVVLSLANFGPLVGMFGL